MRVIPWCHLLERANPTAPLGAIQVALDVIARYKNVSFPQVTNKNQARVKIISSRDSLAGWMTSRKSTFEIRMHPTVNWGLQWYWFGRCIIHEFMHLSGFSNHIDKPEPIMNPSAGNAKNIHPLDYAYLAVYPWKNNTRPEHEPDYLWNRLSPNKLTSSPNFEAIFAESMTAFASQVEASNLPLCTDYVNNSWLDWFFRPRPKVDMTGLDPVFTQSFAEYGPVQILVP